jgi:hypothetical protein
VCAGPDARKWKAKRSRLEGVAFQQRAVATE